MTAHSIDEWKGSSGKLRSTLTIVHDSTGLHTRKPMNTDTIESKL